ncbi:protein kinase domain-containing protein [Glycomyces harbinensis]|uniref:non-specific serine/threonine protein kinase n=1 Tax=Glycomyces harbinensis TaxID=58114 RepID=A0A1G6SWV3_9ACTN|nr:protein kinase [Glycomyces harbinensis]SDD20667.1 Serine/threonine protein kinase [Glycomyces harbinensis]
MSSPSPAIPGYSDLEMVAHGSTAFVYRAVQDRLDRTVAVKVLLVDDDMTTADSVEKELEATVAVSNHPHIVSIIDTGHTETGQPYIVMEYCEGGSYSAILKANGPLPVPDVIEVGVKIGQALQAAHSADILHRDVKPQNILRGQYGPALADFGIARTAAALAATAAIDKLTPLHASPEALLRQAQTPASDLYSLASTMWHLLAGFAPFANPAGGTDPDTHRQRVTSDEPPPRLPRTDVPEWLETLLVRSLSRDPARRSASCQEFADELQRGMYGGGVGKAPAPQVIGDVSNEETVYRPEVASRGTRVPLDPFAPVQQAPYPERGGTLGSTVGGGVTGGGTGGFGSQLGHAVDPRYEQLNGAPQGAPPVSAAPFSGAPMSAAPFSGAPHGALQNPAAPSITPFSGAPQSAAQNVAPYSAPPQAPVSMQPPPAPWTPQQASQTGAPHSAPPEQQVFAPPVIGRDGSKQRKAKAYKAPKPVQVRQKDERSLKSYVVLGVVITVVLGSVMTVWLWLLSPDKNAGDLDQANTEGQGAPVDVAIESWSGGEVTLTWTAPPDSEEGLRYIVFAQRVGDDKGEALNEQGTTETTYSTVGLSPDADYCFNVSALWSIDRVPMSEPVCTADLAD